MRFDTIKKLLSLLTPERAHRLVLANLDWFTIFGLHETLAPTPPEDPVHVMGIRFPNPIGLAAGFDTNGECVNALGAFGFGFIEVGTVSALRIRADLAVRRLQNGDRLSLASLPVFPNLGIDAVLKNLKSADGFHLRGGVLGINLGLDSKKTPDSLDRLCRCLRKAYKRGDYFVLNTTGLTPEEIFRSAKMLVASRSALLDEKPAIRKPLAVKIAPSPDTDYLHSLTDELLDIGVDGIIVGGRLADRQTSEVLSGAALSDVALHSLRSVADRVKDAVPIIACGGIRSAQDAVCRIQAGASLLEILTGFVESGPLLINECINAVKALRTSQS